jgi:ubiquitin carboxyl-terminal hydrolase L3
MSKRWIPLESNPEVLNTFATKLGVDTSVFAFSDIWSMDDEALNFVSQPTLAVIMLFPVTDSYEAYRINQQKQVESVGQTVSDKVFFLRQTIGNACGTIGLLHALGNNAQVLGLDESTPLGRLMRDVNAEKDPNLRGAVLEKSEELELLHGEEANSGQSKVPSADDDVILHFACFVEKDGELYELDGRKPWPINHGKLGNQDLLHKSAEVIRQFMDREPESLNFTMISLGPSSE